MAAPGASDTVVVVTGGDPVDPGRLRFVPPGAPVIAADSGLEHAQALGLAIDLAIGDFDSVAPEALEQAEACGATIERHPADKDATDLELALDAALAFGPKHVLVLGGDGGRLDHLLANALLLAAPAYAAVALTAHMGAATVTVVRHHARLVGPVGDLVSLLPVGGAALGVRTDGLLYPLTDEDLAAGATRGVSNQLIASAADVRLAGGVLVAVQPGQLGPPPKASRS